MRLCVVAVAPKGRGDLMRKRSPSRFPKCFAVGTAERDRPHDVFGEVVVLGASMGAGVDGGMVNLGAQRDPAGMPLPNP